MSGEDGGEVLHGVEIESVALDERSKTENVTEQLKNIRERGNPVTRFQGFEIIQADLEDLKFRELAGEDKNAIKKEKAEANRIKGLLASIDSTIASEAEIENSGDVIAYFEAKRNDWEEVPEGAPDYAEAQANINLYNELIADVREHLPNSGETEETEEKKYDKPTLIELVEEAPKFEYKPEHATKELDALKDKKLTEIIDVEAYYKAQRKDIQDWNESAKDANPEWKKYQPAAVAFIHYFEKPENKGVPQNQPFVVTIQDNDEIDIRPLSDPQVEAADASKQFIVDPERDIHILQQYYLFDLYDTFTKNALTGLEKLKHEPPVSTTPEERDALIRLPGFHRNYIAEHQIERADEAQPTLNAINELVFKVIPAKARG